jgi:glycosyltransferase involved in cell wall biosynthesis
MKLTRQELLQGLRARKRLSKADNEVVCDSVTAIRYRDALELWMLASGAHYWKWVDAQGRESARQSTGRIVLNITRDLLAWPFVISKASLKVRHLASCVDFRAKLASDGYPLYIRSDHWFNLQSGGSVGHVKGVIDGLHSLGLPPHVVSTDHLRGVPEDNRFHLFEPNYGLGRNIPRLPEVVYSHQLKCFIDKHWDEWSPCFVYQRYSLYNFTGVWLKASYCVPLVCEYNGSEAWVSRHWGEGRLPHEGLATRIEHLNLRAADVITVVSKPLLDELNQRGIDPNKVIVNPNGVDPDTYSPDVDGSVVRAAYGLEGKTVVGFIGTFGKWHGAEVLAEAFASILSRRPALRSKLQLLLIGDGVTLSLTKQLLNERGVAECVTYTGQIPQEQGPAHLAACDILISPQVPNPDGSRFFGSPTKLFEYMAMGKGIVASDLDQIGQVLNHEHSAILVKPGDVESLSAGIETLVDKPELRYKLGANARRDVVAHYTWKEHTRRILDKLWERCG